MVKVGPPGGPGPAGASRIGVQGPTGPTGPDTLGHMGATGALGSVGETGPTGSMNSFGALGATGPKGSDGAPSGDPTKMVILISSVGPVAMHCIEATEVLFSYTAQIGMCGVLAILAVSSTFLEVAEDVYVESIVCNKPIEFSWSLESNVLYLRPSSGVTAVFTVTFTGIRRGFVGHRLMRCSEEVMQRNNSFYSL